MRSRAGTRSAQEIQRCWTEAYGAPIAAELRGEDHYAIVRIGDAILAFSDFDGYAAALRDAWESGLIPEDGPMNVLGWRLPEEVASLHAVNPRFGS